MGPNELEKQLITKAIEGIIEHGFARVYKEGKRFWEWHDQHLADAAPGVEAHTGCTKAVFIIPNCNWVVKTPLRIRANGQPSYCSIEADVFAAAANIGLQHYFAACYFFQEVNGVEFYVQEKASCMEDTYTDIFAEYAQSVISRDDYEDEEDYSCALYDFAYEIDSWDSTQAIFGSCDKLQHFCFNDFNLNDFHAANYGYVPGKGDVLIDYSGY